MIKPTNTPRPIISVIIDAGDIESLRKNTLIPDENKKRVINKKRTMAFFAYFGLSLIVWIPIRKIVPIIDPKNTNGSIFHVNGGSAICIESSTVVPERKPNITVKGISSCFICSKSNNKTLISQIESDRCDNTNIFFYLS